MDERTRENLRANLESVEHRIQQACVRAGRSRADVTLVAVTKTVTAEIAAALVELGVVNLGENRPQELWRKADLLPKEVQWHLIGHLQRNKIERTLPLVEWIHAVDSVRLLHALEEAAANQQRRPRVLLEVNASGEATKQGFALTEAAGLAPTIEALTHLHVCGLMTMAAPIEPEACRPTFRSLRNLRDTLQREVSNHRLDHLSMGMSNDFEIAIEEGATYIRLGTVLFESRD